MGLKDILNASKIRKENDSLKEVLTPELQDAANLSSYVKNLEENRDKLKAESEQLNEKLSRLRDQVIFFDDALTFQDYGLYAPRYHFVTSDEYKLRLDQIRSDQKEMIKRDTAIFGAKNWTVDGSAAKGKK